MDTPLNLAATMTRRTAAIKLWDVAVIGAGPAGSLAALQLAQLGRQVLIIERKQFPRYKVCGGCVSPAGMALLDSIGLGDTIREVSSADIESLRIFAFGRKLRLTSTGGVAISRAALDACLLQHALEAGAHYLPGANATVGPIQHDVRVVSLQATASQEDADAETQTTAKLVLAADGLGHPCLRSRQEFSDTVAEHSHLGAGCELESAQHQIASHTLHMAVGEEGYVGFVVVEGGRLNVAAALSPLAVRSQGGIPQAVLNLLDAAGVSPIPALADAHWQGTPALTRRTRPVMAERLFLLGDACGYVEPFTGEGITWALDAALNVAPLADLAVNDWRDVYGEVWRDYHRHVRRHLQRTCRLITPALRRPWLVESALALGNFWPALAQPFAHWINQGSTTSMSARTA